LGHGIAFSLSTNLGRAKETQGLSGGKHGAIRGRGPRGPCSQSHLRRRQRRPRRGLNEHEIE
jgi:hypothetical protein